jgi:hypothetical protein
MDVESKNKIAEDRKMWRRPLKVFQWALGSLLFLAMLVIAINAFDEDLTPEAKALLEAPPNPYQPEENLYLALIGFDAPQGQPLVAAAQTRITAYDREIMGGLKELRSGTGATDEKMEKTILGSLVNQRKTTKLDFHGTVSFCRPLIASCVADVEAHKAEIEGLAKANQELYRRYSALRELKGYYETNTSRFMPVATPPSRVWPLYLANIALRAKTGTSEQQKAAIADLHDDIQTWRLMLVGGGELASKLMAIVSLQGDYALLADLIADADFPLNAFSSEIEAVLGLLGPDDWKIGKVYPEQYRELARTFERVAPDDRQWSNYFLDYFLKRDATLNVYAKLMVQLQKVADADPKEHFAMVKTLRDGMLENRVLGLRWLYNPAGKYVFYDPEIVDNHSGFALRVHDAAAFQRLVRSGYEVRSRKIKSKDIPSFLRQQAQWAVHPVDGRPFVWDEKKQELAMQPLAKQQPGRRFWIPVRSGL